MVDQLYAVRPSPSSRTTRRRSARLRADLRGRSLIVLFTDVGEPDVARTIARNLALLARHHLPLAVTLSDPVVVDRAEHVPASGRELYEKVVAAGMLEERELVLQQLHRAGVLTVDAPADRLAPATINRYLELKERALL
jgi:uncharacterized protein (DUF58 family)